MLWQAIIAPVATLFGKALDVVDKLVPDKDLAERLKSELQTRIMDIASNEFLTVIQGQVSVILAEIQGESWLQRNWRPGLMAMFGAIVGNNYIIAPYLGLLMGNEYKLMLEIPPDMWSLLKLGVSGYVVGRSLEKIAEGDGVKGAIKKIANGS